MRRRIAELPSLRTAAGRPHLALPRLFATVVAATMCLVGCTATRHPSGNVAATQQTSASRAPSSSPVLADPRFAHGLPSPSSLSTPVPPPPDTVGAAAERSITDVVDLHNLAVADTGTVPLPPGSLTAQARDVHQRFVAVIAALDHPTRNSPADNLATALAGYEQIALQLQTAKPAPTLVGQLQHLDALWHAALALIDGSTGSQLSQMVPPLLIPSARPTGSPRPPVQATAP